MTRLARVVLRVAVVVLLSAALLEAAVALLLRYPPRTPALRYVARLYYGAFDRAIIQADPRFARYDPELFYTLRPGRFVYAQREFAHEFRVNRLGVRDEEAALDGPEIVVLGDSIAMGWGVAQEDAFPQLLARESGRRVLNAAVSSYGTVRQLRLLRRLDTSRLAAVVVQYNANDVGENRLFQQRGVHEGGTREKFEAGARKYERGRAYYPGKYAWHAVRWTWRGLGDRITPPKRRGPDPTADEEAEAFLNALLRAGTVDWERVRLVVVEATGEGAPPRMVQALARLRAGRDLPRGIRSAALLETGAQLGPDDFHVLDDHPNARGHRRIADAVLAALRPL
ncbi:MAG TPA: GDSL-type esterase/lipase family protein [Terriglobales bacterium]|nr:GDSL-type esterase/lipase family protein [Terriglobales bacterium]